MSAPNGARRTQTEHRSIPITPDELAACALELRELSVAVLHLHVRDKNGRHTLDYERYAAAIAAIETAVGNDLIIQVTTESVGQYDAAEQMAIVRELRPRAVSLALKELCPDEKSEKDASKFFAWLVRERIWPQYIVYSPQELQRFDKLRKDGLFGEERPFCMLVLGQYSNNVDGTVGDLDAMLAATDCSAFPWSVCCFGPHENAVAHCADAAFGHVRIGFENNIQLQDGSRADDNAMLISQFHDSRAVSSRAMATAQDVRELWLDQ